jgi:hypothetical protein
MAELIVTPLNRVKIVTSYGCNFTLHFRIISLCQKETGVKQFSVTNSWFSAQATLCVKETGVKQFLSFGQDRKEYLTEKIQQQRSSESSACVVLNARIELIKFPRLGTGCL